MGYLALDIGNVLVKVNLTEFLETLSSIFKVSTNEVYGFLRRCQKSHDLGITTMREELEQHFDVKSEDLMQTLLACWNGTLTTNWNMIDMVCEIMAETGLKVAILSNIGVEHRDFIGKLISNFDYTHLSCEVGARKPTKLFYQSFLLHRPEFQGCIYVDDLQENLDTACEMGFNSYKFSLYDTEGDILDREMKNLEMRIRETI